MQYAQQGESMKKSLNILLLTSFMIPAMANEQHTQMKYNKSRNEQYQQKSMKHNQHHQEQLGIEAQENLRVQLFDAVRADSKKRVDMSLKQGANINAKDENGNTALRWAAYWGLFDRADQLLKHGAKINEQNDNGDTALMAALANDRPKVANLLLSHGADVSLVNHDNQTAADIARKSENSEIKKLVPSLRIKTNKGKPAKRKTYKQQ